MKKDKPGIEKPSKKIEEIIAELKINDPAPKVSSEAAKTIVVVSYYIKAVIQYLDEQYEKR